MFSVPQIQNNYPNIKIINADNLVPEGYITQSEKDTFYANLANLTTQDLTDENEDHFKNSAHLSIPPALLTSMLFESNRVTILVSTKQSLPPIADHYHFSIDPNPSDNIGLVAYIKKSELDAIKSITALIEGNEFLENLNKLCKMNENELLQFCSFFKNHQHVYQSIIELKNKYYALHTEGFLTNLSSNNIPFTFMHKNFDKYLTLQDLCNLRLVCKKDISQATFKTVSRNLI